MSNRAWRRALVATTITTWSLLAATLMLVLPTRAVGPVATPPPSPWLKLDQRLQTLVRASAGAATEREVYVLIKSRAALDLQGLAAAHVSTRWPLGQQVSIARVRVDRLLKLAALPGVELVEDALHPALANDEMIPPGVPARPDQARQRARLEALRAAEVPYAAAPPLLTERRLDAPSAVKAPDDPGQMPNAWHDVLVGHGSAKAWALGWRGAGVRVGVADSGIDFATPELIGTWATIDDRGSPYYGWPQALDAQGLYLLVQDYQLGSNYTTLGVGGLVSVTQRSVATRDYEGLRGGWGRACFRRVLYGNELDAQPVCDYRVPWQSASGTYRFAVHPDPTLASLYRERPGVLVVDRARANVYDTVYVDLDNDHDFTDEKPVTREDPLVYRDMDGDGWPDLSGGLLTWISDGRNPPPGAYLWPDLVPRPRQGELLAFIGPWSGSHGTFCGSTIAGQGVVPVPAGVQLRFRDLPGKGEPKPLHIGAAPAAKLVAIHRGGLIVTESAYIYAAYGHEPDRTGDELQILSNSYGFNEVVNEGWDNTSRLIDYLTTVNPTLSYVFSSGNGGPGYGSIRGPHPKTALKVAASNQTGSTGYDSITETRQILWGDLASFSSSGPAADGTLGPLVAADGAYGSGATVLNSPLDGRRTIATWGGTSRSTPVVAGNLALVYQAFRDRSGRWPTAEEARGILMAGATPNGYDPLSVGAGVIDGGRSAAIAGGVDGLFALPSVIYPGSYHGEQFVAFPHLVEPGERVLVEVRLTNYSNRPIAATLRGLTAVRMESHSFTWTSEPVSEESPSFAGVPDYLIPLNRQSVPEVCDLLAVRMVWPLERSDVALNYTYGSNDNAWYLRVYQHTDIDGDGRLWEDRDGDGVVDKKLLGTSHQLDGIADVDWSATEIDRWEYARLGQDVRPNNNAVVWVHHPAERWSDGLYIGLQHGARPTAVPTTTLSFRLDWFSYQPWEWLEFERDHVVVPAQDSIDARLWVSVPADAPIGYGQGFVTVEYDWQAVEPLVWPPGWPVRLYLPRVDNRSLAGDSPGAIASIHPGAGLFSPFWLSPGLASAVADTQMGPQEAATLAATPRRLWIPVLVNVSARLGEGSIALVGEDDEAAHNADLPYPNGLVRGANRWNYGPESGDLRYYFVDVPSRPPKGAQFVVRATWRDGLSRNPAGELIPRSDTDVRIFGPSPDRWSDPRHPDNAFNNLADPLRFGPHTTILVGGSVNKNTRAGVWEFETATGEYEDWVTAPVTVGLHVVQAHNTLISGDRFDVPLALTLERAQLWPDRITGRALGRVCRPVELTTTFALPALVVAGYGPSPIQEWRNQTASQDPSDDVLSASWRRKLGVREASRLELRLDGREGDDLDLFLYFDRNQDGAPASDEQVAASTSSGADEAIDYLWPADGEYLVTVHGYRVPGKVTQFDLQSLVVQGAGLSVTELPAGPMPANRPIRFRVCYDLPSHAGGLVHHGELYLGPPRVPRLFRLPVEVEP